MDFFKFDKTRIIGFLVAIFVFLLIFTTFKYTRLLERLELGTTDFLFWLRDPIDIESLDKMKKDLANTGAIPISTNKRVRKDILIIGIDESTLRDFDNERKIHWPFPWNTHAQLTKYIGSGEPNSILFDIMFLDNKPYQKELAKSIEGANCVFLDYPFENQKIDEVNTDQSERLKVLEEVSWPIDPDNAAQVLIQDVTPPLPILGKAAKGIGFANIFPDVDNINRTMPLIVNYDGKYYPNIDLSIAMNYYEIGPKDVEIKIGEYIKFKNVKIEKMKIPNEDKEIIIPIDNRGFMDVNFAGGFGSFNYYSYRYFARDGSMAGNASLKDKIILIAAYASTGIASDEKQSPYGLTFGIEHHANAINTILNQDFIYRFTDLQNILIMLLIGILLGFFIPRLSIVISTLITSLFGIAYMFVAFILFNESSIIMATASPVLQVGLTFTLIITFRVLTEQKEKKYIRQTFSKFVSKSVVDELLKHPDKLQLGGDKKILTVLFSDIRGFTSVSEKMTPESLVEHLNEYLQAMTDIVIKYNGTLDKYVGDEIMAFWGAPIPQEDHALQSCKAAVEMMNVLHQLNENWKKIGKETLDIGIGLNTGDMIVGNMGSSSRMDYTLMGDSVNLGARLEGTNKVYKTHIIISEYTYEHVREYVIVRELDLIKVKGKELPVKIYELVDIKV